MAATFGEHLAVPGLLKRDSSAPLPVRLTVRLMPFGLYAVRISKVLRPNPCRILRLSPGDQCRLIAPDALSRAAGPAASSNLNREFALGKGKLAARWAHQPGAMAMASPCSARLRRKTCRGPEHGSERVSGW